MGWIPPLWLDPTVVVGSHRCGWIPPLLVGWLGECMPFWDIIFEVSMFFLEGCFQSDSSSDLTCTNQLCAKFRFGILTGTVVIIIIQLLEGQQFLNHTCQHCKKKTTKETLILFNPSFF